VYERFCAERNAVTQMHRIMIFSYEIRVCKRNEMTQAQKLEQIGHNAIMKVRLNKLRRGKPFMINSPDLPSFQCYMEYADGKITIEQINESGNDFKAIRELSPEEAAQLRVALGLTPFSCLIFILFLDQTEPANLQSTRTMFPP
jgi:hypothetical protein